MVKQKHIHVVEKADGLDTAACRAFEAVVFAQNWTLTLVKKNS